MCHVRITDLGTFTFLFHQPAKPRLSRRIVKTARINLNKYWNKFEEMSFLPPVILLKPEAKDNEINDNLSNELKEEKKNG